jgi:hypothetical protein
MNDTGSGKYEEGAIDASKGKYEMDCPYPPSSPQGKDWLEGNHDWRRFNDKNCAWYDHSFSLQNGMNSRQYMRLNILVSNLRYIATPHGSMHALWDTIFDIEAFLQGKETLIIKSPDEWISYAEESVRQHIMRDRNSGPELSHRILVSGGIGFPITKTDVISILEGLLNESKSIPEDMQYSEISFVSYRRGEPLISKDRKSILLPRGGYVEMHLRTLR